MKKILRILFYFLLIAFIIMQFFKATKNIAAPPYPNDITTKYAMSQDVQAALKTSCYDCHSNNTYYPWYNKIQPVAWWLHNHIEEGKGELNFNEFATYRIGKQYFKLDKINSEIKEGGMPLSSYTLIHKDAILTDAQKTSIANWVTMVRDSIKAQYPQDSLKKPARPQ